MNVYVKVIESYKRITPVHPSFIKANIAKMEVPDMDSPTSEVKKIRKRNLSKYT